MAFRQRGDSAAEQYWISLSPNHYATELRYVPPTTNLAFSRGGEVAVPVFHLQKIANAIATVIRRWEEIIL